MCQGVTAVDHATVVLGCIELLQIAGRVLSPMLLTLRCTAGGRAAAFYAA